MRIRLLISLGGYVLVAIIGFVIRGSSKMMLMRRFLGVILILAMGGCSTMTVKSDYDPSINFSGLKTYNWMPRPQKPADDARIDQDSLLDSHIRNAVDQELAVKGFTRRKTGEPDFLIGYYVTVDKKQSPTTALSMYTYSTWGKYLEGGYYEFEEGTLTLDIVNPRTRKLMWRGSARDEASFSESPEKKEPRINEAVRQMLGKFPPR